MALVSERTAATLGGMPKNTRISFREDLNDSHHFDDFDSDGFSSDSDNGVIDEEEEEYEDEVSPSKDPEIAEIVSMERRSLKYRKSLTMMNKMEGMKLSGAGTDVTAAELAAANGVNRPTREHVLAAKKSIDDLTAWVNAGALDDDDDDEDD